MMDKEVDDSELISLIQAGSGNNLLNQSQLPIKGPTINHGTQRKRCDWWDSATALSNVTHGRKNGCMTRRGIKS